MKNRKLVLRDLIIIVIVINVITLINSIKSVSYNESDNLIVNRTNQNYLEKITYLGLTLLKIDGVRIVISDLPIGYEAPKDTEGSVQGFIRHYFGDYYGIYIVDADFTQSVKIISHELIHLYQYRTKRLVNTNKYYVWENDTLPKPIKYKYYEKPWEVEAYEVGGLFNNLLNTILVE